MVDHNLLVLLGPTPNSYFITYGRKFSHENAPDDLVQTFMKEPDMNPIGVAWLSIHPNFKLWAAKNRSNNNIWYDDESMPAEIVEHLNGASKGMPTPSFLSWCDDGKGHFLKLHGIAQWTLDVPDNYPQQLVEIRKALPDFERGLQAVLFGHGGTHIYIFQRGFWVTLEGPAEDPDHPLYKVVMEFSDKGDYNLLEGSHLSLYDDQHFMLKFQKQGSSTIEMRWNLPTPASDALQELMEINEAPEEKAWLTSYENRSNASALLAANLRFQVATYVPWTL